MDKLDAIFAPETIAVIGASTQKGKVGHDIFANILSGGYTGTLYPVNPKAKSVLSVKCYATIAHIPDPIDLAMIILPPKGALQAVKDCITKGVKGIVIVSAGFKEVGGEGEKIELEIKKLCADSGVRLVGPNCLGVINPSPKVSLNASFSARMPKPGNVSFISQSGALCTAVLDYAADKGFGFSKFISIGNKADVDELDLLRYYHNDPDTDVVMIYMEELNRTAEEFISEVREMTSGTNPTHVIVIKSGSSDAGAKAAASHTGALAGSDALYDAIFAMSGILRCATVNQLFDYAQAFAGNKYPKGNHIAIITNAGGPGIIATDMSEQSGLKLAKFSEETVKELKKYLPSTANFHNPVDVIGDAAKDRYENTLATVLSDDAVDAALIILTPQSMTDAIGTAEAIVNIAKNNLKPIVCAFMGVVDVSDGVKLLQKNRIPVYQFPESAARSLGALRLGVQWLFRKILPQFNLTYDVERANQIIANCIQKGQTVLGELEGSELLQCYGFKTLPMALAKNKNQAVTIAEEIGYPVVMKIVSDDILHKTEAGGVVVGLEDANAVKHAFADIMEKAKDYDPSAKIDGVLIQKMAAKGKEVILGLSKDPVFGHAVMFGLGGIFVEVYKDVIFRLSPMGRNSARRMVRSIKGYPILKGLRGDGPSDIETIEKHIVSLKVMADNHPMIKELDINPLFVHEEGKGTTVADTIIRLEDQES
ncbi:MAG: acetate--CoA ligase family protein [Proteobacteria bacterium]|nr:acetate--CoA ligase family protein [Pseudomonadota bacterium]MBU1388593.1 acetate--CoA ligase family protein [Pseudomonadota bacterium]MBU1541749.1 acetate--CoA ligase family protein [Pseudomonadota bacterium]MBU2482351.1 acetate--CoA ligase family protein [Pseudomonadota bacterium]